MREDAGSPPHPTTSNRVWNIAAPFG